MMMRKGEGNEKSDNNSSLSLVGKKGSRGVALGNKWGSLLGEPQYDPFPGARPPGNYWGEPDPALYYARVRGVRVLPPAQPERTGVDGAGVSQRAEERARRRPRVHAWCEARGRAPNAQDGHSGRLALSRTKNVR